MILYWGVTGAMLGLLTLSYMGRWHPAGDAFAVVRPVLALAVGGVLGVGVALGAVALAALALPALSLAAMLWPVARARGADSAGVTLYQKNLSFQLPDARALIADIRACDPDVITLQEVSAENLSILRKLSDGWPHQQVCAHDPVGAVAVLSRWPVADGPARLCATSVAGLRVAGPAGPLWVVSLHLPWPWPFAQHLYRAGAAQALRALSGPVVVAGDFNMVPWSFALRDIARAAGGHRAGPVRGSFPIGPIALPIDHVIGPDSGTVSRRPLCGSDHHGVLAQL